MTKLELHERVAKTAGSTKIIFFGSSHLKKVYNLKKTFN